MDSSLELDRITHPLRLARGSHQPGSGEGCAMNVMSYINGEGHINDFPAGSATPLAVLVQASNDLLAGPDGYLSPESSVLARQLAWQTTGTANVPGGDAASRVGDVSREAIQLWRNLAGPDNDTASGSALVYGTRPLSGRVA